MRLEGKVTSHELGEELDSFAKRHRLFAFVPICPGRKIAGMVPFLSAHRFTLTHHRTKHARTLRFTRTPVPAAPQAGGANGNHPPRPTLFDRIASDPDILGGKPVINSTYICVEFILELVASGGSVADIVMAYPFLTPADVRQAITFALGSIMPAVTTPNYSDPTRFSVRHYLITPSPSGSWS